MDYRPQRLRQFSCQALVRTLDTLCFGHLPRCRISVVSSLWVQFCWILRGSCHEERFLVGSLMPGSLSCYARSIAGIRQAWHLHLDAVSASCPRCKWHFHWIVRGIRHEEPVLVDARDAEPGSCSLVGFFVACVMNNKFRATNVDAMEFFEFMTGVLRAYVSPST